MPDLGKSSAAVGRTTFRYQIHLKIIKAVAIPVENRQIKS